jgi:hypothetical protein
MKLKLTNIIFINGLLNTFSIDVEKGITVILLDSLEELVREPGVEALLICLLEIIAILTNTIHDVVQFVGSK